MRVAYLLSILSLVSCAQTESTSIVVEPETEALFQSGTLREAVGIETLGGVFTPLLTKGCNIPCSLSQNFSTAEDGQRQIGIHLFRGNANLAKQAHPLGTFQITGIAPMPRGEPSIRVEFRADSDGITIKATDNHGKSQLSLVRVAS